jgi:hypothetical protein
VGKLRMLVTSAHVSNHVPMLPAAAAAGRVSVLVWTIEQQTQHAIAHTLSPHTCCCGEHEQLCEAVRRVAGHHEIHPQVAKAAHTPQPHHQPVRGMCVGGLSGGGRQGHSDRSDSPVCVC